MWRFLQIVLVELHFQVLGCEVLSQLHISRTSVCHHTQFNFLWKTKADNDLHYDGCLHLLTFYPKQHENSYKARQLICDFRFYGGNLCCDDLLTYSSLPCPSFHFPSLQPTFPLKISIDLTANLDSNIYKVAFYPKQRVFSINFVYSLAISS